MIPAHCVLFVPNTILKAHLCLLALSTMQILLTIQGKAFLLLGDLTYKKNAKSLFFVFKFFDVFYKIGWKELEQKKTLHLSV